jgi:hypothetical protein
MWSNAMKDLLNPIRLLLALLATCAGSAALSQPTLDRPSEPVLDDRVYIDYVDSNVGYIFPRALVMKGTPRITRGNENYVIHFTAGVEISHLAKLRAEWAKTHPGGKIELFRGYSDGIIENSATDIPSEYLPRLQPLGDPADFNHDIEYALTVKRQCWFFRNLTERLVADVIGANELRHVGTVQYSFVAVLGGQPTVRSTVIPVFVGGTLDTKI